MAYHFSFLDTQKDMLLRQMFLSGKYDIGNYYNYII